MSIDINANNDNNNALNIHEIKNNVYKLIFKLKRTHKFSLKKTMKQLIKSYKKNHSKNLKIINY